MSPEAGQWQQTAVAALARAGRLLEDPKPETLDACRVLLEEVRIGLRWAAAEGGHLSPQAQAELRSVLLEVRKLLFRLHLLLEHAAGFHAGWLRLKNILTGGYTALGEPATVASQSRVSLEA